MDNFVIVITLEGEIIVVYFLILFIILLLISEKYIKFYKSIINVRLNSMSFKNYIVNLLPGTLIRFFASPYIGGYGLENALTHAEALWTHEHKMTTLDLLGESIAVKEEVEAAVETYLSAVDYIIGLEYVTISLKLSALGILIDEDYTYDNLSRIVKYAHENGVKITLDMEDSPYTDITLRFYLKLLKEVPTFGTVLQSRLHRTADDIENINNSGLKGRFRTCIGIYNEPPEIAEIDKNIMKSKLMKFAENLLAHGHFVEIGTHDKKTIAQALEMVKRNNYSSKQVEFQYLLGVPLKRIQQQILDAGYNVRLYLPFVINKSDATAYLRRRMLANPNMAYYVIKNLLHLN